MPTPSPLHLAVALDGADNGVAPPGSSARVFIDPVAFDALVLAVLLAIVGFFVIPVVGGSGKYKGATGFLTIGRSVTGFAIRLASVIRRIASSSTHSTRR